MSDLLMAFWLEVTLAVLASFGYGVVTGVVC